MSSDGMPVRRVKGDRTGRFAAAGPGQPAAAPGPPGSLDNRRREKAPATVLDLAFRLLARRSYPQAELRSRLERDWDPPSVASALLRLSELHLIDDAAWAQRFAGDRFERCGRGRHRILSELVARGVEAELAARVVARVIDPERERDRARALLASLLGGARPSGQAATGEHERAGAFRRLVARGFPAALVRDLLAGS